VLGHTGITGNAEADEEAKRALKESISNDEKYHPENLRGWIETEIAAADKEGGKRGENIMKKRKKNMGLQNDTEKLKRRDQVEVTTSLRTGYSRATHRNN
jgi:hypothetical protein